jgi:hypothetical protein
MFLPFSLHTRSCVYTIKYPILFFRFISFLVLFLFLFFVFFSLFLLVLLCSDDEDVAKREGAGWNREIGPRVD